MQAVYIAPGKVLLSWDTGQGPTWAVDPEGKEIKAKFLGTCEVWRCANAVDSGGPAVKLGETEAEAFYDVTAPNGATLTYWVMEQTAAGSRQVGPTVDVLMPQNGSNDPQVLADKVPPSVPDDLAATVTADGNLLEWLPSQDAESGLLAYFVYDSNQDQPDSVVWASDEEGQRVASFLDRTPDANKGYCVGAIDVALNLSDLAGPVLPVAEPAGVGLRNLFVNPRFHVNATDGWYAFGEDMDNAHEADADAISINPRHTGTFSRQMGDLMDLGDAGPFFLRADVKVDQDNSDPSDSIWSLAYDAGRGWEFWSRPTTVGEWLSVWAYFPSSAAGRVRLEVVWNGSVPNNQTVHLSHMRCDLGSDPGGNPDPGYYDGDSSGWEWTGTPHNSQSRKSA